MNKPVILTGLRANNDLHLGNYFGAMLPLIDMARRKGHEYQINMFVPDLHSFTTPVDHASLQANIVNNLRVYAAAGLDLSSDSVHIYRQSHVSAHSELTWILDCFTGMGEMNRMTQFKDKSSRLSEDRISVGLFHYPVLMAADILLYGASYVPVGEDQTQHLEFTRDIATRLNNRFGELFTIPKAVPEQHRFFGTDQGLRIKDLADPSKKMSKSDETGKGVIFLSDDPAAAAKKVMAATTDSYASISLDREQQPGISNLLQIAALLEGVELTEMAARWQGQAGYGDLKKQVAGQVESFLQLFQKNFQAVEATAVAAKLKHDEVVMNEQANATLHRVQQAIGLREA